MFFKLNSFLRILYAVGLTLLVISCESGNDSNDFFPTLMSNNLGFLEADGVVVVEMESTTYRNTDWVLVSDQNASNGAALQWTGNDLFNEPGIGVIEVDVIISNVGTYRFDWANKIGKGTSKTEANDTWLKIESDRFYAVRNGSVTCPKGFDALQNNCVGAVPEGSGKQGWFKVYRTGGEVNDYIWSTKTFDRDPHDIFVDFNQPGNYKISIAGRSTHHTIDRFIMTNDESKHEAAKTQAESKRGNSPSVPMPAAVLTAKEAFISRDLSGFPAAYFDKKQNALALDARYHKGVFSAASTDFRQASGVYDLSLTTLTEIDGESKYRLVINGVQIVETYTNPETISDYAPSTFVWRDVELNKNDRIRIEFSSETNGKIPEGDGTAYSRGRWTQLTILER